MKIAFTTLGCKLNYAETSTYERGFLAAGWEVVPFTAPADVYLINTCSVTETAEKKSRNLIRRAHKLSPDARIVVTGCYAQLRKDQLLVLEGVWRVFGAGEKTAVVPETVALSPVAGGAGTPTVAARPLPPADAPESTQACPPAHQPAGPSLLHGRGWPWVGAPAPSATGQSAPDVFGAYSSGERTRSFLKVQDGCDNFCAYCTVPYARGRSRNVPVCEAVKSAREIAAQGVKEIVLTGVNTGDFGRTTGESFLSLLQALNEVEGIERYRISSIEPNLITPEIIEWIASGTKFQPHFHIPLQSGSDTLLRRVGRRYDTALFAGRIDAIRATMEWPGKAMVFFGIDVIVGLPGETEELFAETYRFLAERVRPAFLHVFPYSRRPGTRAAEWKDQVQDSIKTARVARLEALSDQLHAAFLAANHGLPERVLWESSEKGGLMGGYTGNYIRLERPFDPARVNTLEDVLL